MIDDNPQGRFDHDKTTNSVKNFTKGILEGSVQVVRVVKRAVWRELALAKVSMTG